MKRSWNEPLIKNQESEEFIKGQSAETENLITKPNSNTQDPIQKHMHHILLNLRENPKREGLLETPKRYAKTMRYLTSGYTQDVDKIVGKALFYEESSEIVLIKDIDIFSLCEHHLLPFYGKVHVAYIPNGKIIGLSKIPRIVEVFARRLQVQERLTSQISQELLRLLKPHGVAVVIEAFHMCMMMRGVEKQNSYTITRSMLGAFNDDIAIRQEFFNFINQPKIKI